MTWAFGGPEEYKGRSLRDAHAKLVADDGLGDEHFDRVAKHLDDTLTELGVERSLIDEALAIVASQRDEVLGR
jgi:hemoglobin